MRGNKLTPLFLGALMVLPAVAMPAAAVEPDMERFHAERLAELQAMWEQPSALTADGAAALLDGIGAGLDPAPEEALELLRWLRDAQAQDALLEDAVQRWVSRMLLRAMQDVSAETWQQDKWDALGVALTVAYLAAAAVSPEFLPHNIRIPGIYADLGVAAGCTGGWSSGYCFLRLTLDLLALAALDWHFTTDTIALQLPLSIELRLNWRCSWGCSFWPSIHFPNTLIATDAAYVLAFPAMSGEMATRATDSDLLQIVYDRLGRLSYQKAREITSAPLLGGTAVAAAVPGGTPGVADLHAVSPEPNYYGLQVPPEFPAKPALPATPALPPDAQSLVNQARAAYGQVHLRVRDDFGTAPVDSLGPTVGFTMGQVRAWNLNIAIVRWKNLGAGAVPGVAPPASFYYDAAGYFNGGGGNQWTEDYGFAHGLV